MVTDIIINESDWSESDEIAGPILVDFPEEMSPHKRGFIPLSCGAHWIASQGGSIKIDAADVKIWKVAFEALLARISQGDFEVIGQRPGRAINKKIPASRFAGLQVIHVVLDQRSVDLLFGEKLVLDYELYIDEKNWRDGHGDRLLFNGRTYREKLQVSGSDIAKSWPFAGKASNKPTRGRSPNVDWTIYEGFLRDECKKQGGVPSAQIGLDWSTQAHAERFIYTILEARREKASESTVRSHVSLMLGRIKQGAEK